MIELKETLISNSSRPVSLLNTSMLFCSNDSISAMLKFLVWLVLVFRMKYV